MCLVQHSALQITSYSLFLCLDWSFNLHILLYVTKRDGTIHIMRKKNKTVA
jgi:hypothetical protein